MFIVELEEGVWLARWKGDPGRTLKKSSAKIFKHKLLAEYALIKALSYRKFENAKVIPISIVQQAR